MDRVLALVLAGGEGQRLYPLTKYRSKPAVPFGGKYRIIDFTLSNCINSGIRQIYVLTQYRSSSLNIHIQEAWGISSSGLEDFIYCVPAQQKVGGEWYRGTADAVRQNLDLLDRKNFSRVIILSGDHIYKMNYLQMMDYHREKKADLTLSAIRVRKEQASGTLGVVEVDRDYRVLGFEEKPLHPKTIPDAPDYVLASMGIYIFEVTALREALQNPGDDFGRDIIPRILQTSNVYAYDYEQENRIEDFVIEVKHGKRETVLVDRTSDSSYWRDVGSIDAYYEANMDLVGVEPLFNLYGQKWPFRTHHRQLPPSKFVLGGTVQESIVCSGCIISGGFVKRSILSPGVIVERDSVVQDSIIFDDVIIEPNVQVHRAIVDKEVILRSGSAIGFDIEADRRRGCIISDSGIVVVPRNTEIKPV